MSIKTSKHVILTCNFCGAAKELDADGTGWLVLTEMSKKKGKHVEEHACAKCSEKISQLKRKTVDNAS